MSFWNPAKAKVQLRLSVQRLRTLQQKKEAQAKASRRDIASLIEKGKLETARIKVETIINEDIYVELLELLELYCELLLARFGLLDQKLVHENPIQGGIAEGVCSVIHAAPRTEIKELHVVRDILMHKYGRDFSSAVMENIDGCVSPRVMSKLTTATPSSALVDAYISEIAKAYGVPLPGAAAVDTQESGEVSKSSDATPVSDSPQDAVEDGTAKADAEKSSSEPSSKKIDAASPKSASPPTDDSYDALLKRFADLKKR